MWERAVTANSWTPELEAVMLPLYLQNRASQVFRNLTTVVKKDPNLVKKERLWINSGVRQWRGHGVATGALFGVPSDILIWPHFHSQAAVPFVLAGVCQSVDDGEKLGW